jgi:tRNA A-37 threonylcarbamoyl transferase component Bud32
VAIERARLTPELEQLIVDPDAALDAADCRRLKNGNTCTVGLVQAGARKVVVKRYNVKNFWHGLGRALRRTRASVSWTNAHLLQMLGISTPAPLALVERRWGWLRRQSYFLAEYVAGPDMAEVLADPALALERKRELAAQMAALMRKLCLLGIEHGDMKASNFLLVDGAPLVIDLDAMRLHAGAGPAQRRHARDLRRFLANWQQDAATLQMMKAALAAAYGNDPVLALAGVAEQGTSENT